MAFCLEADQIDYDGKQKIIKELTLKPKKDIYSLKQPRIRFFDTERTKDGVYVYIPIGAWREYTSYTQSPGKFPNGTRGDYPRTKLKFKATLFTPETDPIDGRQRDQTEVAKEMMSRLRKSNGCFVSVPTGFGKTMMAAYATCKLRLKTLVLSHNDPIKEQFFETFDKFTDAKIQIVKGSRGLDPDADVYIIGVIKCSKSPREWFKDIGFVIIDEAQLITQTAFSKALLKIEPVHILGLSATPDRNDGLHKAFEFYFGSPKKFVSRFETKNFTVIRYGTKIQPDIEYTVVFGKTVPNWSHIIGSIEEHPKVHKIIANIILRHPNEKIMVLSSRTAQTEGVEKILLAKGESVETYIGNKKKSKCDLTKRVLLTSTKKGGVGFDDPTRTMLIIGCDTKDPRQYEGRIRTANNIVYYLVHNYSAFKSHYNECEKWFLKRGATIEHQGVLPITKKKNTKATSKNPARMRFLTRKD